MAVYMTQKELAELVGITPRQIRNINQTQEEGKKLLVKAEGGKYDAPLFLQRWIDITIEKAVGDENSIDAIRARHELIKMEKTKLEVEQMRGELLDVRSLNRAWEHITDTITRRLVQLPGTLAPLIAGMDSTDAIRSIIDTEIRGALNEIADTPAPEWTIEAEDAGDTAEAAEDAGDAEDTEETAED